MIRRMRGVRMKGRKRWSSGKSRFHQIVGEGTIKDWAPRDLGRRKGGAEDGRASRWRAGRRSKCSQVQSSTGPVAGILFGGASLFLVLHGTGLLDTGRGPDWSEACWTRADKCGLGYRGQEEGWGACATGGVRLWRARVVSQVVRAFEEVFFRPMESAVARPFFWLSSPGTPVPV